jgi:hypothetical protein
MKRLLLLLACLLALTGTAGAVTYDLQTDWSNTNNPKGPWAYLQGTSLLPHQFGGALGPFDYFAPGDVNGNFLPAWWQVPGVGIYTHSLDWYNGNPILGESVLTWTSPTAGIISISGMLWYGQTGLSRSNDFFLYLGSTLLDSGTVSYLQYSDKADARLLSKTGLTVNTGDVVSLVIQRSFGYDPGTITAMSFTITETPVPLPGAVWLLGGGLVGLGVLRRKFNKG